jgi:hypothetical protein
MEFVDKKELTKDKFAYLLNISGRNFAITYLRDDIETPTKDIYTRLHDNTYISVRYGTLRMEPDLINLSFHPLDAIRGILLLAHYYSFSGRKTFSLRCGSYREIAYRPLLCHSPLTPLLF